MAENSVLQAFQIPRVEHAALHVFTSVVSGFCFEDFNHAGREICAQDTCGRMLGPDEGSDDSGSAGVVEDVGIG